MQCEQQGWIKARMLLAGTGAEAVTGCDMIEEWIKMLKWRLKTVFQDSINDDKAQANQLCEKKEIKL